MYEGVYWGTHKACTVSVAPHRVAFSEQWAAVIVFLYFILVLCNGFAEPGKGSVTARGDQHLCIQDELHAEPHSAA